MILLTGKGAEADRVVGLKLGADDYVVKPFSPAEVEARISSVLRRVKPAITPLLSFDGLTVDLTTREVHVGDRLVDLTAKEFDLLTFMASSPARCSRGTSFSIRCGTRRRSGRAQEPSPSTSVASATGSSSTPNTPAGSPPCGVSAIASSPSDSSIPTGSPRPVPRPHRIGAATDHLVLGFTLTPVG